MSDPKKSTAVRLSDQQIAGLKLEANKIARKNKIVVGWTTLIGIAVDEHLASRRPRKVAA